MKSSYELAMERLQKQSPTVALTDAQKAEIAELDSLCRAKLAEKELFLGDLITKARTAGNLSEIESLTKQLAYETTAIREEFEAKKEKVRKK